MTEPVVVDYGKFVIDSKGSFELEIIDSTGWSAEAADGTWTWYVTFAHENDPDATVLSYPPDTVTISTSEDTDDTLTLEFSHTPSDLPSDMDTGAYYVGIKAEDGSGIAEHFPEARGECAFLEPVGG